MVVNSTSTKEVKGIPKAVWGVLVVAFLFFAAATFAVAPGEFVEKLRILDSGICSQWQGRSFYPAGVQLPLCARNTGIYLGVTLGLSYLVALGRGKRIGFPPLKVIVALVVFIGLMGVDGLNSTAKDFELPYIYEPNNLLRLAAGLGTGLSVAVFLLPALGILLWREGQRQPILRSYRDLAPLLALAASAFLVVASQVSASLYPVAIASTLGLVTMLAMINLLVLLAMSHWQNRSKGVFDIFVPGSVALFFALAELVILALFKHWAWSMLM